MISWLCVGGVLRMVWGLLEDEFGNGLRMYFEWFGLGVVWGCVCICRDGVVCL